MKEKAIFEQRIKKVLDALNRTEMDGLLLNRLSHIAYLTGAVNSCSWVFITKKGERVALVLDSDIGVYKEDSIISDLRNFHDHDPFGLFKKVTDELGLTHSKIGIELGRPGLPQNTLAVIRAALPPTVQFLDAQPLLEESRVIKTTDEIEAIKNACKIAELGIETAIKTIKPGIREIDVIIESEYAMQKTGGRIGNVNYLASGKRSSLAHQLPSHKTIESGDVVVIDIHDAFQGFCADIARTMVCGKADQELERGYSCLRKAVEESLGLCRKGTKMAEIRKTFYKRMGDAKGLKFTMGPILHGVGMVNYEMPYFSHPYTEKGYPEVLAENMVVAISNIGLYSPQNWGLRLEDTVLVTEKEPIYLTNFGKELRIL
jgi:Xaa-Pro aminopeptidase